MAGTVLGPGIMAGDGTIGTAHGVLATAGIIGDGTIGDGTDSEATTAMVIHMLGALVFMVLITGDLDILTTIEITSLITPVDVVVVI